MYKKTLYKNSMVLSCNRQEGTVWLLDILAQLRKVRARVTEETEDYVTLHGRVGDVQNPDINFNRSAGPTTYDSRGVVEDWVIEPEPEEEEEETEVENFETDSVDTDATEPLEIEEEQESFFQNDIENNMEIQQDVHNVPATVRDELENWDIPNNEDWTTSWLNSVEIPPSRRTKRKQDLLKTRYPRRSQRLRNQRRNATTPWR
jgi:hypothetical protein